MLKAKHAKYLEKDIKILKLINHASKIFIGNLKSFLSLIA